MDVNVLEYFCFNSNIKSKTENSLHFMTTLITIFSSISDALPVLKFQSKSVSKIYSKQDNWLDPIIMPSKMFLQYCTQYSTFIHYTVHLYTVQYICTLYSTFVHYTVQLYTVQYICTQ